MRGTLLLLWLLPLALPGQLPPAAIPDSVGVNIHFDRGHARDLGLITNAGIRFVRMDFSWSGTEAKPGSYQWGPYDDLTADLEHYGLRAIYIFDFRNPLYEPMEGGQVDSPRHPASVAAFAQWAGAAAAHFRGRHIVWEIYNEPNGGFWRPKPDAKEYADLALPTAKAIRQADPSATILAPAVGSFGWGDDFMETVLKSGLLEFLDGVSVHPYRPDQPPETAAAEYQRLRKMIDRYAPPSRRGEISIISGEWGYTSYAKGVSLETQADYAVRMQLANLLNGIPLSIWYDWKNDGRKPSEIEENFGLVDADLNLKPAFLALQTMTSELAGYRLERRLGGLAESDFVIVFVNGAGKRKAAAWTMAQPHTVLLTNFDPRISLELKPRPAYLALPK